MRCLTGTSAVRRPSISRSSGPGCVLPVSGADSGGIRDLYRPHRALAHPPRIAGRFRAEARRHRGGAGGPGHRPLGGGEEADGRAGLERVLDSDLPARARGGPRRPRDDRRVDDDRRLGRLLDPPRGPDLRLGPVLAAGPGRLRRGPGQPDDARSLHRHLHLLPADPAGRPEPAEAVRPLDRGHRRDRAGDRLPGLPPLLHPPHGRRRSRPGTSSIGSPARPSGRSTRSFPGRSRPRRLARRRAGPRPGGSRCSRRSPATSGPSTSRACWRRPSRERRGAARRAIHRPVRRGGHARSCEVVARPARSRRRSATTAWVPSSSARRGRWIRTSSSGSSRSSTSR